MLLAALLLTMAAIRWPAGWGVLALAPLSALVLLGLFELDVVVTISHARSRAETPITDLQAAPDPLYPLLAECLSSAAVRVGVPVPVLVLVKRLPGAVTISAQAQTGSSGTQVQVSLASTLLLAPIPERLTAVLAHELVHLRYHDLRSMVVFILCVDLLLCLAVSLIVSAAGLLTAGLIALGALSFEPILVAAKSAFMRRCEDRADQVAAATCGARPYAQALLLLHAQYVYGEIPEAHWPDLLAERPAGLAGLQASPLVAALAHDPQAQISAGITDSRTWGQRVVARLRDPHRPDAERIKRLGLDPREVIVGL
jgi:Zn-dependent protease with chaperone function